MGKDFSEWCRVKQTIENTSKRIFYREGEVRWCSLGLNVGLEMDGKGRRFTRPVLIVKALGRNALLCMPVTTKIRLDTHYRDIDLGDGMARQVSLSQIRFIDTKRLGERLGAINKEKLREIKQAAIAVIA